MFKDAKAISSFSVDDVPTATEFYGKTLGLQATEKEGLLHLQIAGGGHILVYPKSNHIPATFTVLNLPVDNIEQTVKELNQRNIQLEQYEGDLKTNAQGIAVVMGNKQAWFKDPAGNILSIMEGS